MQLLLKRIVNGSLIERDYLLNYTVGSVYNEISLYIEENKEKPKKA
jgi:hypothetical protein